MDLWLNGLLRQVWPLYVERTNMSHFLYADLFLPFLPSRPQAAGPPGARVLSIARPGSACVVCNTRAALWRVGAKDTAPTAAFIPQCSLSDTRGSCKYVAMLMRCDNPDLPWATAQVQPRAEIRERYAIRGHVINDWLVSLCCTSCALTQERREVEVEEASFRAAEQVQQVVQVHEK